jgi:hypothetical protein
MRDNVKERQGAIMENIKTSEEVEEEFRADLIELLKKYNATMEADDFYPGYPECGQDIRITVSVPALFGKDGQMLKKYAEINLGKYIDGEEK